MWSFDRPVAILEIKNEFKYVISFIVRTSLSIAVHVEGRVVNYKDCVMCSCSVIGFPVPTHITSEVICLKVFPIQGSLDLGLARTNWGYISEPTSSTFFYFHVERSIALVQV
jgi:hypothetical protein